MILSAQSIRSRCLSWFINNNGERQWINLLEEPMIYPFFERRECVNHDGKLKDKNSVWDLLPHIKRFSYGLSSCGYDVRIAEDIWLWPLWGRLASTIECFNMPNDVMAEVKDKSSWARRFVTVQNTVIEPGWKGWLTLELTNHRLWPVRIKAGTPIAQIVFKQLDKPTEQPYRGKYQNQAKGPQKAI